MTKSKAHELAKTNKRILIYKQIDQAAVEGHFSILSGYLPDSLIVELTDDGYNVIKGTDGLVTITWG